MLGFLQERRAFEASICHSCGTRAQDWQAVGDHPAFMLDTSICQGCRELERHRRGHADDTPGSQDGRKVFLVPFDQWAAEHPDGDPDDGQ